MTQILTPQEVQYLELMQQRSAYRDMALKMQQALKDILALNPADTEEGYNEWGEAECFVRARRIALDTFDQLKKEFGNEPLGT